MTETTRVTCAVDASVVTTLLPVNQPKLFVVQDKEEREISLREKLGELSIPSAMPLRYSQQEKQLGTSGLVVIPIEGGGRGPIINYGETITLSLLFKLLANALTKDQLSPSLVAELDRIADGIPNTKDQCGYAKHNETITLNHLWNGYPPIIELSPAPGSTVHIVHTQVGEAPDCITYVEIPLQELVYGHSGIVNQQQFTVKAAILEKTDPLVKALNWQPAAVTGPPLTALTGTSPVYQTTVPCMGLRIQGSILLANHRATAVSGAMYVQLSVDTGPWVNIGVVHWNFKENDSSSITEMFDVIMAYDHSSHTYRFRGQLITNSSDEPDRELTGQIQIASVTEFGSGAVLSNDLLIQWASKEKL